MKLRISVGLVAVGVVLLSACASTGGGSASEQALQEVSIDPVVKITDKVYYNGPENNWGFALGGVVGSAIASQAVSEPERIKMFMDSQHIDLSSIVKSEYKNQLEQSPQFAGKVRDQAKAKIELEIQMYGFAQKGAFSSQYKPMLRVDAKLVDPDGKVMWEKADFVANLNGTTPGYTYAELYQSPGAMENAFTIAAQEVVKSLVPSF